MSYFKFGLLGLLALLPALGRAETLESVGDRCMTYSFAPLTSSTARDFKANLKGTSIALTAENLETRTDLKKKDFSALNGLAAYLIMTGYYRELGPHCAGLPYPELNALSQGFHELKWRDVALKRSDLTLKIKRVEFSLKPDKAGNIDIVFKAEPITTSRPSTFPRALSGSATLRPAVRPPYKVKIKELRGDLAGSRFSGRANISAGADLKSSTANMHLSIDNIAPAMKLAADNLSPKTNTTLLIARLMATHEGENRLGWDAELENEQITVNGIRLPVVLGDLN